MSQKTARILCLVAALAGAQTCHLFRGRAGNPTGAAGVGNVRTYTDSDVITGVASTNTDVFVSTLRGVMRYPAAGGAGRRMTRSDGLPDTQVLAVSASSDGAVWAATANGVARLAGEQWALAGDANAQPNVGRPTALLALGGGGVLLGGAQGLARFDGTHWHQITNRYQVTQLVMDQGQPVVATANAGILALRGDFTAADEYGSASGIPEPLVRNVVPVGEGKYWALVQGTNGTKLAYFDGHRWFGYTHRQVRSPWIALVPSGSGAALVVQGALYNITTNRGDELRPTEAGSPDGRRRVEFATVRLEPPPPPEPPPEPQPRGRGRGRGRPPAGRGRHAPVMTQDGANARVVAESALARESRGEWDAAPQARDDVDDAMRGAQARDAGAGAGAGAARSDAGGAARAASADAGAARTAAGAGAADAGAARVAAGAGAADAGAAMARATGGLDAGVRAGGDAGAAVAAAGDGGAAVALAGDGGAADAAARPAEPAIRPRDIPAYAGPVDVPEGGPTIDAPTFGLLRSTEVTLTEDIAGAHRDATAVFVARVGLGVTRISGGAGADFRSHDLAMQRRPLSLATDANNNVWLVTEDLGPVRYDSNRFSRISIDPDPNAVPLMFWSRGTIAAAVARVGPNVVRTYRFGGNGWRVVTERPIDTGGPGTVDVKFLAVDSAGRFWLGIRVENEGRRREHGVAVIDESLPAATQFNHSVPPAGGVQGAVPAPDDLTAVDFAQNGTAWFAGLSGATSITLAAQPGAAATVRTYNETNGLRGDLVSDLVRGPNSRIYLATTDGLGYWDGERFGWDVEGSSAMPRVIALASDDNGALWGAGPRGAWRYDGARFRTVGRADGLPDDAFTDVAADGENRIWFVTADGISILSQPRGGLGSGESVSASGGGT